MSSFNNCPPCPPCGPSAQPSKMDKRVNHEYVPFQRTVTVYEEEMVTERVPIETKKLQKRGRMVRKPIERTVVDYIKIQRETKFRVEYESQHKTQYMKQSVPDFEYVPVEKKIIHYPEEAIHSYAHNILQAPKINKSLQSTVVPMQFNQKPLLPTNNFTLQQKPYQPAPVLVEQKPPTQITYQDQKPFQPTPINKFYEHPKQQPLYNSSISTSRMKFNESGYSSPLIIQNLYSGKTIQPQKKTNILNAKVLQTSISTQTQKWKFKRADKGFKLSHNPSGLVLDFSNYADQQNLFLTNDATKRTQIFQYEAIGTNGVGMFKCLDSDQLCLGISNDSKAEEAVLTLQKIIRGKESQLWKILE